MSDDPFDFQPMPRWERAREHVTWALRHPYWALCFNVARLGRVRKYALDSTPHKELVALPVVRVLLWHEWERKGLIVEDHPAGCFYGTFLDAYPDNWHIPYGVECELPHGPDPIQLQAPGGTVDA